MSTLRTTNIKNPDSIGNNLILDESGGVVISGVTTVTTLNATQITGVSGGMVVSGITTVSAGSTSAPSISPSGDSNTGVFFPSADTVALSSGGTERIKVDSSGNIDIDSGGVYYDAVNNRLAVGTTTVNANLHTYSSTGNSEIRITSNSSNQAILRFGNTVDETLGSIRLDSPTDSLVFYGNNDTEAFRVDSSRRLLVGTSNSNAGEHLLQIQGNTNSSASSGSIALRRGQTNPTANETLGEVVFTDAAGGKGASISAVTEVATWASNDYPTRLVFSTTADGASSPTERMRIRNDGSIGTYSSTSVLELRSSATAGTGLEVLNGYYSASSTSTGTRSVAIYTNGNIQNTNNSYGALSDIKLKENIVDATSQWDDLKALQVRNYNFKEGQTHTQIGLIAQEVELVSPGLVSESPDRDEDGNDLGTVTKSVNYSVLYMKAVKALQEAMERIETLESENTTLKDDFIELAARVSALEGN